MPGFKAKPAQRNIVDLISTLTDSPVKTTDNALYQTVFSLINVAATRFKEQEETISQLQAEVKGINRTQETGIPSFFFMGSS